MKAKDVNYNSLILSKLFHEGIISSVEFVVEKCLKNSTKPQEPDFIAGLTLKFTPILFKSLQYIFPKTKLSVTGIYCHQKPIVNIGTKNKPELGDVMFVYLFTDGNGVQTMNSLLFQAKVSNSPLPKVSSGDQHQLDLYLKWPEFTYTKAGKLNDEKRNILPKAINDGAQYLLIDNDPVIGLSGQPGTFPMGCATPSQTLNLDNPLSDELVDFIKFKAGRIVENNPISTNDDWTKMVWDLLEIAKEKASRRKNMDIDNLPRITTKNSDGLCFFQSESKSIFLDLHQELGNSDIVRNPDGFFDEENPSTSIILIESSEENEGEWG